MSSDLWSKRDKLKLNVFDYKIHDQPRDKYTIFRISVRLGGNAWEISRRYNEFDKLNNEIKRINPDLRLKFPPKNFLFRDNFDPEFIKKRMEQLNVFLNETINYENVFKMQSYLDFLLIKLEDILNCEEEEDDRDVIYLENSNNPSARPSDFDFLRIIGTGSFGKVYMAKHKLENKTYAIKVLNKEAILKRNEVKHIMAERNVLINNLQHPFLVGLHYSFQSADKLYLVLDHVNGGELFFHLSKDRTFKEYRVKFYSAEIAHAIGYMHSKNIIYRDLKPENILIDSEGHIKLTDFGLCKEDIKADTTTSTFCGTPEYLAPEILLKKPYTRAVDWWCLGCVIYEMLYGLPPFYSRNTKEMYENILNEQVRINPEIPVSDFAKKIIYELLKKKQFERLGSSEADFEEVQDHQFFSDIDWTALIEKRLQVPWIPGVVSETDLRHIDPQFTREQVPESVGRSMINGNDLSNNSAFSGFTYVPDRKLT
ncbi:unnamed protein product [Brachionus calyciflorus]|uniref:Uncharacterized protein n=1 Tax=Brachionus calyciflorus TaxID=104777 RepID=A0A814BL19_9BILA|nr:unnamed protein product [Brachionus calyciflorus]